MNDSKDPVMAALITAFKTRWFPHNQITIGEVVIFIETFLINEAPRLMSYERHAEFRQGGFNEGSDKTVISRLRDLRLWHWHRVISHRNASSLKRRTSTEPFVDHDEKLADMHLCFVQTLNQFFAIDDTAEGGAG